MPVFPGSTWVTPVFSVVVFAYGGWPFLKMTVPELRKRQPGMMTLISLAMTVLVIAWPQVYWHREGLRSLQQ